MRVCVCGCACVHAHTPRRQDSAHTALCLALPPTARVYSLLRVPRALSQPAVAAAKGPAAGAVCTVVGVDDGEGGHRLGLVTVGGVEEEDGRWVGGRAAGWACAC